MGYVQFELNKVVAEEVKEIIAARERSLLIHRSSDIDASGDEVETKVREIISRKLPLLYYTGHGHIVDASLNHNGQHDLIIADNSGSPVLFTAENGTQYFPYESVYAFAEIKSTFRSSAKPIQTFLKRTSELYSNLKRQETSPNQVSHTFSFSSEFFTNGETRPYKSNIFKFMFFVNGGDFKTEVLSTLYAEVDNKLLPNLLIILDQGIVINCMVYDENGVMLPSVKPMLFPEFNDTVGKPEQFRWLFVESSENNAANNLAMLHLALNDHLRKCLLLVPNLGQYFNNIGLVKFGRPKLIC